MLWEHHFVSGYLDDVLFIPLVFLIFLFVYPEKGNVISISLLVVSVLFTFCLIEIVFGRLCKMNTYDILDFVAYSIGALIVLLLKKILDLGMYQVLPI